MRGKKRAERTYSPEERAAALEELSLNSGNLSKTAKETGISVANLYRWQEEQLEESMDPQAREMAKFIKNAWKNIHALNKPKFVKELKVQALKKGHLKEVFASISILVDKMITLTRLQLKRSKEAEPEKLGRPLTEKDLQKLIDEEERKLRRHKAGQDEEEV